MMKSPRSSSSPSFFGWFATAFGVWLIGSLIMGPTTTTTRTLPMAHGFSLNVVQNSITNKRLASHHHPSTAMMTLKKTPLSLQAKKDDYDSENLPMIFTTQMSKIMGSAILSALLVFGGGGVDSVTPSFFSVPPAIAAADVKGGSKVIGELKGSGIFFKDTLLIERFSDPKVKGVTLYISNFDRPITEKLSGGNFFNDPSYASVSCAKTGPIAIADNINKGPQGEEVFEESRSLLFKTLRVQRIYDTDTNTVVYVSFNTRFDKNDDTNKSRFKSSLCAVNLNDDSTFSTASASTTTTSSDAAVASP